MLDGVLEARHLRVLRAAHPGTRVSLEEAEPPRSVEMLREGECDVALAFRYETHYGSGVGSLTPEPLPE